MKAEAHRAREAVKRCGERIRRKDPRLGAFVHVRDEEALAEAQRVEPGGAMWGLCVAVKSNICVKDLVTDCCSRILEGWASPYDATVVQKLRQAGGLVMGNTNMDEFAMGSSTELSAHHVTRNPHDETRVPGGSSGGSAAAVSSHMVDAALGSDTAGSVRQPAALCGVVGVKPTRGVVSRWGLIAFASSLDQVGTLAPGVNEAFEVLEAIAGHDPLDATSLSLEAGFFDFTRQDRQETLRRGRALRVGLVREAMELELDPGLRCRVEHLVESLRADDVQVEEISLPSMPLALPAYHVIAPAECSTNLSRFDGMRYGPRITGENYEQSVALTRGRLLGPEVKRRILVGTFVLTEGYREQYYEAAQRVRAMVARDHERAFDGVDVLMGPTTSEPAFALGEKVDDPMAMYATDALTCPASLAGLPAASVPCGTVRGLPVGVQVVGPRLGEAAVHAACTMVEELAGGPNSWTTT